MRMGICAPVEQSAKDVQESSGLVEIKTSQDPRIAATWKSVSKRSEMTLNELEFDWEAVFVPAEGKG